MAIMKGILRRGTVLGFMVSTLGLRGNELGVVLDELAPLHRPVSVLAEGVEPRVPRPVAGNASSIAASNRRREAQVLGLIARAPIRAAGRRRSRATGSSLRRW